MQCITLSIELNASQQRFDLARVHARRQMWHMLSCACACVLISCDVNASQAIPFSTDMCTRCQSVVSCTWKGFPSPEYRLPKFLCGSQSTSTLSCTREQEHGMSTCFVNSVPAHCIVYDTLEGFHTAQREITALSRCHRLVTISCVMRHAWIAFYASMRPEYAICQALPAIADVQMENIFCRECAHQAHRRLRDTRRDSCASTSHAYHAVITHSTDIGVGNIFPATHRLILVERLGTGRLKYRLHVMPWTAALSVVRTRN